MSDNTFRTMIGAAIACIVLAIVHLIVALNSETCARRAHTVYKPTTAIDSALISHVCQ